MTVYIISPFKNLRLNIIILTLFHTKITVKMQNNKH